MLEIGPGSGRNLKMFDDLKCETVAVELSFEMSKVAKKWSLNSNIINGNILECEFEKESFDIIFIVAVIYNFSLRDVRLFITKINSLLRNDGYLNEKKFLKRDFQKIELS